MLCLVSSWIHAGHSQRATGRNLHRGIGAAVRIDGIVAVALVPGLDDGYRILGRQVRHLGHDLEADAALGEHDRGEIQADAEFLERDPRLTGRRRARIGR